MFGTTTTAEMSTSVPSAREEKRALRARRFLKAFMVYGTGFIAFSHLVLFITSLVATFKAAAYSLKERTIVNDTDVSFNTYALHSMMAAGAFACFASLTIISARASCLAQGAQVDIAYIYGGVLRTLWVILPLLILGWFNPAHAGPGIMGAFSLEVMPGAEVSAAAEIARLVIHSTL